MFAFVGAAFGFLVGFIIFMVAYYNTDGIIGYIIDIACFILPIGLFTYVFSFIDNSDYLKYIESYKAKKETIEVEIRNKSFEELEKIGIFDDIVEINSELAEQKVEYKKWIYFTIDKSLIDELEPINLEGEE